MIYHLFQYLETNFHFPGGGLFNFISFRTGLAFILSLMLSTIFGRRIIDYLQKKQIGETIRDLGLEGQMSKRHTYHGWNHHHHLDTYPVDTLRKFDKHLFIADDNFNSMDGYDWIFR